CPAVGKADCEQKLRKFLDDGYMRPIPTSAESAYRTNFFGVAGRKRWRPVLPLIETNTLLRELMRVDPILNQQKKIRTCLNRLRLAPHVRLYDVSDAYMRFRVSSALASLLQIRWNGLLYEFTRMIYGSSIAPAMLEGAMGYLEGLRQPPPPVPTPLAPASDSLDFYHVDLHHLTPSSSSLSTAECLTDSLDTLTELSTPPQCSYMDDILSFHSHATDTVDPALVDLYKKHDLPLTSQSLIDTDPVHVLGVQVHKAGSLLRYNPATVQKILDWDLTQPLTYRKALGFLGLLLQESDLLPFHVLPCKNALTGLVSRCRSTLGASWNHLIPSEVHQLLLRWQDLLRSTPPTSAPRYIDPHCPLHIYVDASKSLLAYEIVQNEQVVLRGQLPLTRRQRAFHINTLELLAVYTAVSRLRSIELDARITFTSVHLYCDSVTAVSLVRSHRVPPGPQEPFCKQYLLLLDTLLGGRQLPCSHIPSQANPADAGTRCDLYDAIQLLREKYLRDKPLTEPTQQHTACPVRKRAETSLDEDTISHRVKTRRQQDHLSPSSPDLPPGVEPPLTSTSSTSLSSSRSLVPYRYQPPAQALSDYLRHAP
ncbi:hypothetical protein FOZ62_001172, partial [Perkinsus olseni]